MRAQRQITDKTILQETLVFKTNNKKQSDSQAYLALGNSIRITIRITRIIMIKTRSLAAKVPAVVKANMGQTLLNASLY